MIPAIPPLAAVRIPRFREYCRIISRRWESGADPDPVSVFEELPELLSCDESIRWLLRTAEEIARQRGIPFRWEAIVGAHPLLKGIVEEIRSPAGPTAGRGTDLPEELFHRGHRAIRLLEDRDGGADHLGVDSRNSGLRLLRVCRDQWPEPSVGPEGGHPGIVPFLETGRSANGLGWSIVPLYGSLTLAGVLRALSRKKRRPLRAEFFNDCVRDALPAELGLLGFWQPQPILARCSFADGIVWFGAQVAASIDYLHQRGAAYGRLRPENVLLSFSGQPMLVGHGWRSSVDPSSASARGDIVALGVLLRELLGVERPHKPGSAGFDSMLTPRLLRLLQLCELGEITAGELVDELPRSLSRGLRLQDWDEESDSFEESRMEESPSHSG